MTDLDLAAAEIEKLLVKDIVQGVGRLAEVSDRYAGDRGLVYRSVLLKRDVMRSHDEPSLEQQESALRLLREIVSDSRARDLAGEDERQKLAEIARTEVLHAPLRRDVVVSVKRLNRSYQRTGFSLRDITFDLHCGKIMGVVGRNGNGKTTLFRLIVGELLPTAGELSYPSLGASGVYRARRHIAYVQQELPEWYGSLRSNLHYEAAIHGIRGKVNEREVDFIVERLGLSDELNKSWRQLSGGFKLRFALARALVSRPKLLVLDEPLANLDFIAQQIVLKDLRHLADSLRYPLAIMISSQHLHELEEVSDDVLFLSRGRATYSGPMAEIGASRQANTFEIGGTMELGALRDALRGEGLLSVYHSGISYVVTTTVTVSGKDMLARVLAAGMDVEYFRDISRSTKSLFHDEDAS